MRRMLCSLLITGLLFSLSGCALFPSRLHGVERLLVVQALGLDAAQGEVQLSMASAADSARGEGPVRMSGEGSTIRAASNDIVSRATEEELFCAHTGVILLGEESAPQLLGAALRYVCRSREIRMDVPLYIVRGESAETALLETGGERIGAVEILEALTAAAPSRDGFAPPSVAEIAGRLESGGCALAAAVACTPASEQEEEGSALTLSPAGCAVIQNGGVAAFIEQEDIPALDCLIGAQGVHDIVVTDAQGQRVTLQTAPGKTSLRPLRGESGSLSGVEIAVTLPASVAEIDGRGALSDAAYADALAALLERELLSGMSRVVQLEKTLRADFLGLEDRIALRSSAAARRADGPLTDYLGTLGIRLSVSVTISHSNDVRDG